jgi:hypothetical protein
MMSIQIQPVFLIAFVLKIGRLDFLTFHDASHCLMCSFIQEKFDISVTM